MNFDIMRQLYLFFLLFTIASSFANEQMHVTVKVKSGDVLINILKKYDLNGHSCNTDSFYALNKMQKGDYLLADFSYQLPLKIFTYNGESIRSTIGNNDWDTAVAIQNYNKSLAAKGVKTYYQADNILYVPYHLLNCDNPPTEATNVESIEYVDTDIYFGAAKIKKVSNDLANQVFYVISGHGGPDPGAMCSKDNNELCEDEYAYDVSLRLAKRLLENGATVHMIIQDPDDGIRDETYLGIDRDEISKIGGAIPLNQVQRLKQRVDAVNSLYASELKASKTKQHKVIAIHVDSRSKGLKQDVFFYHAPGSTSGNTLAYQLHGTFKEKYEQHRKGRGYEGSVSARNLYVLRNTHPTAVFVELANIQNRNNHQRILPSSNRQVLANWLYEGIIK